MNYKINWQTTVPGITLIVGAILFFIIEQPELGGIAAIAGIGLLQAKAQNVTGTGDDAKTNQQIKNGE